MKRRRRNNGGTKFYMFMSIFCLVVLFVGYSYVYNLSEARKTGQDITTISINYEDKENQSDKNNLFEKIMSYFNIFLEETFKENKDISNVIESETPETKQVFKVIDSKENLESDLQIFNENTYDYSKFYKTEVYLANNRKEDFFKVIESPSGTSRSSVPRNLTIDAASINEHFNIIFYHTHGTEAFLPHTESNYRTKDLNFNIMGIGNRIASNLSNNGLNVVHLKDYNDYPDYNKSYANSNYAVKQVLSNNKKNFLIDFHRDGADENSSYEEFLSRVSTTKINGQNAATCTLVVGEKNGNNEELKKIAKTVFDIANEMYPGLFRDVIIRPGAYFNQYLSDYAMLIEVGSTLNHIEEVQYTADLLSEVICETLNRINK